MARRQRDNLLPVARTRTRRRRRAARQSPSLHQRRKGRLDVAVAADIDNDELRPIACAAACTSVRSASVSECSGSPARRSASPWARASRSNSSRFAAERAAEKGYAGDVAARPVEAGDQALLDRIAAAGEDDRNRRGRRFGRERRGGLLPTITATGRRTRSAASAGNRSSLASAERYSIATFWPSTKPASFKPCRNAVTRLRCVGELMRCGRTRPPASPAAARAPRAASRRRTAEQRDELAPPHSITSSAVRLQRSCGTVRPSALAVLRLITNSNLVDCMNRQVGGLLTLENPAGVDADLAIGIGNAGPVAHQAASHDKFAQVIDRRQHIASRQRDELLSAGGQERTGTDEQRTGSALHERCKGCLDVAVVADIKNDELLPDSLRRNLQIFSLYLGFRTARVHQHANCCRLGHELAQQFQIASPLTGRLRKVTPVTLPLGRFRLATRPSLTGSAAGHEDDRHRRGCRPWPRAPQGH